MSEAPWIIWGSELSPFTLKVIRLFRHAGRPFRFLPTEGSWLENVRCMIRIARVKRGSLPLTVPKMTEDDEFPLVPFVLGPDGSNLYDSTAIAEWLDRDRPPEQRVIPEDPEAAFVARLIDDYADEFLLYVVHHNRWVVSARDNNAGQRVAREWRSLIGPAQALFARWFSARQKRRLPYLFSTDVTRPLLDAAFLRLLDILEKLLAQRPFILGTRFTLADAAIYGQLGMNLPDPSANALILERAPGLHRWLTRLHGAEFIPVAGAGKIQLDGALTPLLTEIAPVYIPLMQQNAKAHAGFRQQGFTCFNEAAFDRGEMLYDGVLEGRPFRTVAKSFQARVWRETVARYRGIGSHEQYRLSRLADLNFT